MGARYAPASPSASEDSFVSAEIESKSASKLKAAESSVQPISAPPSSSSSSSLSRRNHKPSAGAASTSPTRNGRVDGQIQRLSLPPSPSAKSYLASRPKLASPAPRRPRPPASRSSHGIETLSGPPPALITRRSYAFDPATTPKPAPNRAGADDTIDSVLQASHSTPHDRRNSEPLRGTNGIRAPPITDKNAVASMSFSNSIHKSEEDEDWTVRANGQKSTMRRTTGQESGGQPQMTSPEDLFLGLAREDSVADDGSEVMSRSERRRSRLGAQSRTSRAPSSTARPSTSGAQFPSYTTLSPSQNETSMSAAFEKPIISDAHAPYRSNLARSKPYAASAHPLDEPARIPHMIATEKASFSSPVQHHSPESQRAVGRRSSVQATSPMLALHSAERSHLARRRRYASPPFAEQSRRDEGTESTVSTRAASTVWDELDDMKSRIRQLELSGKLPPSSNAAISNAMGDRPPTAGTTMTTLSSSPKHRQRQSVSPENNTIRRNDMAEVHPLLQSALKRSKETLNADVYQILEATAADALTLAATVGDLSIHENGFERQLRRKADSVCRFLTELCIALAEEKADSQSPIQRHLSGSKKGTPVAHNGEVASDSRFLRGVSEDPELRASSRVMSRLESRRASLLGSGSGLSPQEVSQEPSVLTQPVTSFASKLDRTSSVLRRREKDEEVKPLRAPSRATTEVGQMRPSPQSRISREYISNHPLPKLPQRSPSVQSSLPLQKSYFSSTTNSPVTPSNVLPGNKRYLHSSNTPSSSESTRLAEARQRRLASLGQPSAAGQPLVGRLRPNEAEK